MALICSIVVGTKICLLYVLTGHTHIFYAFSKRMLVHKNAIRLLPYTNWGIKINCNLGFVRTMSHWFTMVFFFSKKIKIDKETNKQQHQSTSESHTAVALFLLKCSSEICVLHIHIVSKPDSVDRLMCDIERNIRIESAYHELQQVKNRVHRDLGDR